MRRLTPVALALTAVFAALLLAGVWWSHSVLYVSCMALVSVITAVVWWVWLWKLPSAP